MAAAHKKRFAHKSLEELIIELLELDPTADSRRLFQRYCEAVKEDREYLENALWPGFMRLESFLRNPKRNMPVRRANPVVAMEAAKALISKHVKTIYLNLPIGEGGKKLRHCTFKEVAAFGGQLTKIAKMGRPEQLVGDVLNEGDLAKVFGA